MWAGFLDACRSQYLIYLYYIMVEVIYIPHSKVASGCVDNW